jgi:MoxR-like ATPase
MRTPSYDPAALEAQIGPRDGTSGVTSANRHLVQNWLVANGVPSARAKAMKLSTLWKCYNRPKYLTAVVAHIDGRATSADVDALGSPGVDEAFDYPSASEVPAAIESVATIAPTLAPASDAGAQLAMLIQSLAAGAINEARVLELIREHAPVQTIERVIVERASGARIVLSNAPRHSAFEDVLACVAANIPVMLVGPAGAGKTTLGKQIGEALELSFAHVGAVMSRYELSGFVDAQGRYQQTAFRDAYEHGGVFLFDEIDASDAGALLWCNAAIANGMCAFPDGNIERHADFRLIAAANTFGRGADRVYVGRNQLDGATLDRFAVIDFDYDETLERAVFGDTAWTRRVEGIRAAIASLRLRHVVSPRAVDYGARLLAAGMPQTRVEAMVIWKGLPAADSAKIEAAVTGGF